MTKKLKNRTLTELNESDKYNSKRKSNSNKNKISDKTIDMLKQRTLEDATKKLMNIGNYIILKQIMVKLKMKEKIESRRK